MDQTLSFLLSWLFKVGECSILLTDFYILNSVKCQMIRVILIAGTREATIFIKSRWQLIFLGHAFNASTQHIDPVSVH